MLLFKPKMLMVGEEYERHIRESQCATASSNSIVTPSTPPPTLRSPSQSPYYQTRTVSEKKRKGTCFTCGNQGHWANDCPSQTPPLIDAHLLPVLRCFCGAVCTIFVARAGKSPGRRYYSRNCNCKGKANGGWGGNFYKWCDEVTAPLCKCGAGACTINFQKGENGNYIKYYTCRIRTGHGSCDFVLFENLPSSPRSMMIDKRTLISSPEHSEPMSIMTQEDELPIPNFSNRSIVVGEAESSHFLMEKEHRVSLLASRSAIRSRQMQFWNQISDAANSPTRCNRLLCKVLQSPGHQFRGWVGRLLFPPPPILSDAPLGHFFCLLGAPLETSSLKRSFTAMLEGERNPISKEVGKNHQQDLSLLESMEPTDHSTMLLAANAALDALASPFIERGPFAKHLMKSVQCTLRVAEMESTLQDNCKQPEFSLHKNVEKCLDDISGFQEAFTNVTAWSNDKVASQFKDMLFQIEKLETCLLDAAKEVGQVKRNMQATYQELTKSLKLSQEEEDQCMARPALDGTCSSSSEIYMPDGSKRLKIVEVLE